MHDGYQILLYYLLRECMGHGHLLVIETHAHVSDHIKRAADQKSSDGKLNIIASWFA